MPKTLITFQDGICKLTGLMRCMQSGTKGTLTRVYGASTANVFLFGDGGAMLRTGQ